MQCTPTSDQNRKLQHEHPLELHPSNLRRGNSGSGVIQDLPTTWVPMATATMAWEARKAAACGCIGRAEAPRRPPEWRRSRCCTVVHSIGAPDLVCSGIRGLCVAATLSRICLAGGAPPCPLPLRLTARRLAAAARSCCGAKLLR